MKLKLDPLPLEGGELKNVASYSGPYRLPDPLQLLSKNLTAKPRWTDLQSVVPALPTATGSATGPRKDGAGAPRIAESEQQSRRALLLANLRHGRSCEEMCRGEEAKGAA
jgi:hypothetical protein